MFWKLSTQKTARHLKHYCEVLTLAAMFLHRISSTKL
jgi:hypothetical protein